MTWFDERLYTRVGLGYAQCLEAATVIAHQKSDFQDVIIFDNPAFGRVLALDGVLQTSERDEFVYHEMLTHVPILAHGRVRRVLIIGGGDGGILREALRHPAIEKAVMVEIDGVVVDLCRRHMPSLSAGAFDDPRAQLLIDDGIKYVKESPETFDVIIVDSTDPFGPGEVLFSEEFYAAAKRRLTKGGVIVTQNGVPFHQGDEVRQSRRRLTPSFADVTFYVAAVPGYVGGFMALGWATDDRALRSVPESTLAGRFAAAGLKTRYYTPAVHRGAFALPPFIAELEA